MQRHVEGGFDPRVGCFVYKFVMADAKPGIPLGEWLQVRVRVPLQGQAELKIFNGESQTSPGDFYAFALLVPKIKPGQKRVLNIAWQRQGMVDAAWWNDVWLETFHRTPPRFGGPPMCIMGLGNVPQPGEGTIL